jgi:signal transduction histidine kinase
MSFGSTEMPYVTRTGPMPRELSHELRTPLAVIRMQAQLLLRSARQGAFAGMTNDEDRDRLLIGLQRIDDAVTKLDGVLERVATIEMDKHFRRPNVRNDRKQSDKPEIH